MVAFVDFVVFGGAFTLAIAVIAVMVAPQWRRILSLAMGHAEVSFTPLAQLAGAERRIAVRRWAARPVPAAISRLRAVG